MSAKSLEYQFCGIEEMFTPNGIEITDSKNARRSRSQGIVGSNVMKDNDNTIIISDNEPSSCCSKSSTWSRISRKLGMDQQKEKKNCDKKLSRYQDMVSKFKKFETKMKSSFSSNDPSYDIDPDLVFTSDDDLQRILNEPTVLTLYRDVAIRWTIVLTKGLNNDIKEEILKKYKIPDNCTCMNPPKLNEEIKIYLTEGDKKNDQLRESKQSQISCCLTAIGVAINTILGQDLTSTSIAILKTLGDAGKLLCDVHYVESQCRRNAIIAAMRKHIRDILVLTSMDDYLFGADLSEYLKMRTMSNAKMRSNESRVKYQLPPSAIDSEPDVVSDATRKKTQENVTQDMDQRSKYIFISRTTS